MTKATAFRVGVTRNALLSPNAPKEHAVGDGLTVSLCGVEVMQEGGSTPFGVSAFACKRCMRVFGRM